MLSNILSLPQKRDEKDRMVTSDSLLCWSNIFRYFPLFFRNPFSSFGYCLREAYSHALQMHEDKHPWKSSLSSFSCAGMFSSWLFRSSESKLLNMALSDKHCWTWFSQLVVDSERFYKFVPISFHKSDVVSLVRAGSEHFVSTIKARLFANKANKIPLSWHAPFIQFLLLIKKINVSAQLWAW